MTNYEIVKLFAVIVAIYSIPAAICWYLIDRKLKQMEEKCFDYIECLYDDYVEDIANINSRLRNIK